jgi:Fe-S-cluster containining protein
MIKYINTYEVCIDKCGACCQFRHRVLSWVYVNDKKIFYFGLTIAGLSVTIQKKHKKKIEVKL